MGEELNVIAVELLRYRLEAICAEGGRAIERTAISPIVTESKDYSCTMTDAAGNLVGGGGKIRLHYYCATSGVQSILRAHGNTIAPGDMFLLNDPHQGGALHPQDMCILVPVFAEDSIVAWFAASAHMMDAGGMSPGSYSPDATECYQEALRLPPVRIKARGIEQDDIWAILRNNIRMSSIVEMDLRSLAAGCNVASAELVKVVDEMGARRFCDALVELSSRVEAEVRRRISELTPGHYRADSWVEWQDETHLIPCTLIVEGGKLIFDFSDAPPQVTHFINSKDFIVASGVGSGIAAMISNDLPYNAGLFACLEFRCPEGTIVNCRAPAPIGNAHMEVGMTTAECATRALTMAVEASPNSFMEKYLAGPSVGSGYTAQIWGGCTTDGEALYWTNTEAMAAGGPAAATRDGSDLGVYLVGPSSVMDYPDVETWEGWYPWRIIGKRIDIGTRGAGAFRAGGRLEMTYEPLAEGGLAGVTIGNRARVPVVGMAGGYPGGNTARTIFRADGSIDEIPPQCQTVALRPGDRFVSLNSSGGGWGDPLDRKPALVEKDVALGAITTEAARRDYGVVVGDADGTAALRQAMLNERMQRAMPAVKPLSWSDVGEGWHNPAECYPICTGVQQQGGVAVSTRSGVPLALAPAHWTDGCPMIRHFLPAGADVEIVAYLEPQTGHVLFVDVIGPGRVRSFESAPARWSQWRLS